jgi:hypothetical protein
VFAQDSGVSPRGVQSNRYNSCSDAGVSDAYACSLSPSPGSYSNVKVVYFKANTINTGAATLNLNGLGAKTIKKQKDQDLADGDIKAGQLVEVQYDGTNFQLLSAVSNAGGGGLSGLTSGQDLVATSSTTASSSGVKRYTALLTQTSTAAPVATVLQNTLSGTPAWARASQGTYTITLASAFTSNKTVVMFGTTLLTNSDFTVVRSVKTSTSVITIYTLDVSVLLQASNLTDELLNNTEIKIEVYP